MQRRGFLLGGAAVVIAGGAGALYLARTSGNTGEFPLSLTEQEWRERLTDEQFAVLRQEDTEEPFSSPLNDEKRDGIFTCAGCGEDKYLSDTKFMSGTGWPSFTAPIDGAVGTRTDYKLVLPRTEVHCSNCGGHLGHIFDDGPEPTGKRHCLNGTALGFRVT